MDKSSWTEFLDDSSSVQGDAMRKWYFPMTVLGLGGLGMLLFTERGRRSLQRMVEFLPQGPDQLAAWNETAQRELDRIQMTLDQVAKQLEGESFPAVG